MADIEFGVGEDNAIEISTTEDPDTKRFKSEVWAHFSIPKESLGKIANCKYCTVKYNISKGQGSDTNLNNHLKRQHPKQVKDKEITQTSGSIQSWLHDQSQKRKDFDPKLFRDFHLRWIVGSTQPFLEVESPQFKNMILNVNPKAILDSRYNCVERPNGCPWKRETKTDRGAYDNNSNNWIYWSKFSIGLDGWTSPNRIPLLGVTIHWVGDDWTVHEDLLEFKHLLGKHDGRTLCEALVAIFGDFQISFSNILGVTCDNASNNDTLFEYLEKDCKEKNISFESNKSRIRCFAHFMNLCIQDMLKHLKSEQTDSVNKEHVKIVGKSGIGKTVSQLRALMIKIKYLYSLKDRLYEFCDQFGVKKLQPVVDVKHRCNSTHAMNNRAEDLKGPLNALCASEKSLEKFIITESQW
ncbi:unnamed protein product [Allacma fusca]|uniref:BED-type domain-containing protein n=1 Tax=Allacma fusca TaxID=39272 RepID=A0A8J2L407_9HEXA|nr:unnamed protein product [Allacma fusca]